jgi:hypothetical protein
MSTTWTRRIDGSSVSVAGEAAASAAAAALSATAAATSAAAAAASVASSVTATGGTVARTLAARFADMLHVDDFTGADPTGVADSTAAFTAAFAALGTDGGTIWLSQGGTYYVATSFTIPVRCQLRGHFIKPGSGASPILEPYSTRGSTIKLNPAATITVASLSGFDGITIVNSALTIPFSQANAATQVAAFSGTAVSITGKDVTLRNALILGFAKAVFSFGAQRFVIDNVLVDCTAGFDLTVTYDIGRISNCHCYPYLTAENVWSAADPTIITRSGIAYRMADVGDWNKATNCFSYGYACGYEIDNADDCQLVSCSADYNGAIASTSVGFRIKGTAKRTALISCQAAAQQDGVYIDTTGGATTRIIGCSFWSNDQSAIHVVNGKAQVVGSSFSASPYGILAGALADELIVTSNYFETCATSPISLPTAVRAAARVRDNVFSGCTDTVGDTNLEIKGIVSATPAIGIDGAATNNRTIQWTTADAKRWSLYTNGTAESGSDVGSDFVVNRYNDAGTFQDSPLTITRSTGVVSLTQNLALAKSAKFSGVVGTAAAITVDGAAGQNRILEWQSATSTRFKVYVNGTAEGGSNAGSDFAINSYTDAGAFLATPLTVTRSSGITTLTSAKITGNIGFYGTTPAAKPAITGSRSANAALADLLTKLAALGLITDSTSA